MAQIARTESNRAINAVEDTTDKVVGATRNAATASIEAGQKAARRSTEGASAVSQMFVELVKEQTQRNMEVFQALTRTVSWSDATKIQTEYLRESFERMSRFTRRYIEVGQGVMGSAMAAAKDEAAKAA
jgi:phasin family protein